MQALMVHLKSDLNNIVIQDATNSKQTRCVRTVLALLRNASISHGHDLI